jgi:hypothetical protein
MLARLPSYAQAIRQLEALPDVSAYLIKRGRKAPAHELAEATLQAFLAAVHLGLQGLAIQESAREIQRCLGQLQQDLARLEDEHQKVGRHLDNARSAHDASARSLARVGERLAQATASARVEVPAQSALPLDGID